MPAVASPRKQQKLYPKISKKFQDVTKNPEIYLSLQPKKATEIRKLLKDIYDLTIQKDETRKGSAEILPELVLEGLDEEQIWQQVELRNSAVWSDFIEKTSKLTAARDDKFKIPLAEANESEGEQNDMELGDEEDDLDEESDQLGEEEDEDDSREESVLKNVKIKPSIVDDQFFKLSEMEAFLNAEDEKELRKQKGRQLPEDDDGIDYFNGNLTDEDDENAEYGDFFAVDKSLEKVVKKSKKQTRDDDEEEGGDQTDEDIDGEDDDDEDNLEDEGDEEGEEEEEEEEIEEEDNAIPNGDKTADKAYIQASDDDSDSDDDENAKHDDEKPKSSFELRQERLQERIRQYEEEVLGEKPWQLKGEITSASRPQNSLLEEILEFDATTRPAPIITEETTLRLEDIIRQRIKDSAWDDVERTVRPVNNPQEYRKQIVLDQEKSKQSLAQIYEKEYQNEIEKLNPNADAAEEEPAAHKEIKALMRELFVKLDALSNFHFTPKPVAPEPKIITNTPAVSMEEVAPVGVSDATLLAPEEIRKRAKGDIIGKAERSRTDKNRERRKKKLKQKAIHKALETRDLEKQKLGIQLPKKQEQAKLLKSLTKNRNVDKMDMTSNNTALKSSTKFFSQLQDKASITKKTKSAKPDKGSVSAKKLKL